MAQVVNRGVVDVARFVRTHGQIHNGSAAKTLGELTATWRCVKRDGTEVPFDPVRITAALMKCFLAIGDVAFDVPAALTTKVVYALAADRNTTPGVEDVQRTIIRTLWMEGHFDHAEQYQNYREQRRQRRELLERATDPAHEAAVAADRHHFPSDLQYYVLLTKFSRWREDDNRRETWRETCDRVMDFLKSRPLVRGQVTDDEWEELDRAMHGLEVSPAMRVVQMAGPALERCNSGGFNCMALPIADLRSLPELLYLSMQGCGVGFTVEDHYVGKMPVVQPQSGEPRTTYLVADDTEGWCDALHHGLQTWFSGGDVWFDVSHVRPANSRLKTKGGRASGAGPLLELLAFTRKMVMSRQGQQLTDRDWHDLACMTGKIVRVGGVRRSALISLSDLSSQLMREAKSGDWWNAAIHRTMANNSAVYESKPDAVAFMREWLTLASSGSGERGIFNRDAARKHRPDRRQDWRFICNPCAEVILRTHGCCNLSIAVARPHDTRESLRKKVRLATIFGVIQSTCTDFKYIRPEWKQNADEERLLGVDITGHADCPLLRYGAPGRAALLRELKAVVAETRREFAARFGINESAADTCVKPGGDSAVLFDCASGVSPRFSKYQVRWVRESANSPVAAFLKDAGVPWAQAPEEPSLLVFGFPKASPEGSTTRDDLTAIQQLENWLEWKTCWAEHSVSATIYVEPHEWLAVGNWVYEHFDHITGLSFLPKDNGVYAYAPNESLTEQQYEEMVSKFPTLRWDRLTAYELEDATEATQTVACVSGACAY